MHSRIKHLTVLHDSRIGSFCYCLFIFSWWSDYFIIILYLITLYTRAHFLIFHTHWEFWLLGFPHPGLCMLFYWLGIWRGSHTVQGANPFLVYSCFYSRRSLWFPILDSMLISISLFICYHMRTFICTVVVILIHHNNYIAYSGYLTLNAYTWGIFLPDMRRRLSSRIRSSVFWEAGRDRVFLLSEPSSI